MSTHILCFEQKYEKYQIYFLKIFIFQVVKFSIYLNRHVFVMICYVVAYINCLLSDTMNKRPFTEIQEINTPSKYSTHCIMHSKLIGAQLFKTNNVAKNIIN